MSVAKCPKLFFSLEYLWLIPVHVLVGWVTVLSGSPSTSSWVVKTVYCRLPGLLHGEVVSVAIRDGNFTSHWWASYRPGQCGALTGWNLSGASSTEGTVRLEPKNPEISAGNFNLSSPDACHFVGGGNSLLVFPNINCKHSSLKPKGATRKKKTTD